MIEKLKKKKFKKKKKSESDAEIKQDDGQKINMGNPILR